MEKTVKARSLTLTLDPRAIIERNHNELFNEGLSLTSALGLYNRPGLKGSVIIMAHDPGAETLNVIQQYAKRYDNNARRE